MPELNCPQGTIFYAVSLEWCPDHNRVTVHFQGPSGENLPSRYVELANELSETVKAVMKMSVTGEIPNA